MSETYLVYCSCEPRQANELANLLVEEQLAACVQILPAIHSVYRWQGQVERAEENLLLIKCPARSYPALQERIQQLHNYETPEIIALPLSAGLPQYLAWVDEQCL